MAPAEVGMIAAVSIDGVIGRGGGIPWDEPADRRRFVRVTTGSTVVMGRRTWESLHVQPLPSRRNIVITRSSIDGAETFASLEAALAAASGPVWLIGGAGIYEAGLAHADLIDVTVVPHHAAGPGAIRFPALDRERWTAVRDGPHPEDPRLRLTVYRRSAP